MEQWRLAIRSLVLAALLLIPRLAWALCPAVITDCPYPVFNGLTSANNINMLDNKALVMSTDATKSWGYQTSANAVVLTNVVAQFNLGVQMPQNQPVVLNAPTNTAVMLYDSAVNAIRFKNIPVQIDAGLNIPGGSLNAAAGATFGAGLVVNGVYSGTAQNGLSFVGGTYAGGSSAIVLGDNSDLQFSTNNTGYAMLASTTTNSLNITANGAKILSIDNGGNLTIAGQFTTGNAFQGLQTFNSGILIAGGGLVISTAGVTLMASSATNAIGGFNLSATTFSGNTWDDGHISFSGLGDALINSATTLATAATTGFMHIPHTSAVPTGAPVNTTPGCEWNTASHTMNCYDGSSWYHATWTSGAF